MSLTDKYRRSRLKKAAEIVTFVQDVVQDPGTARALARFFYNIKQSFADERSRQKWPKNENEQ